MGFLLSSRRRVSKTFSLFKKFSAKGEFCWSEKSRVSRSVKSSLFLRMFKIRLSNSCSSKGILFCSLLSILSAASQHIYSASSADF